MSNAYKDFVEARHGIIVRDPANIYKLTMPKESEQATMCILIDYYEDQNTIPPEESTRLKELVNSPDKENMEIVKVLLQQKYKVL